MKFLIFSIISFYFSSLAVANFKCEATCISKESFKHTQSGSNGAKYSLLRRAIPVSSTGTRKGAAWRNLKDQCGPYLLVISYETKNDFILGEVLVKFKEARKRNACDLIKNENPPLQLKTSPPLS